MTEDFMKKPESIFNAAIHAGLFGKDDFLYDKQGFIDRCCGSWNMQINNHFSCPTEAHENAAEELHELYVMYREFVSFAPKSTLKGFSRMFIALANGDLDAAFGEFGKAKWAIVSRLAEERNKLTSS